VNDVGGLLCRYAPTFEDMYTQMEARQKERQNQMRDQASQGSVLDKVKQVRVQLLYNCQLAKAFENIHTMLQTPRESFSSNCHHSSM